MSFNPNNKCGLSAPFTQATIAAALDYEVEIVLAGEATMLAKMGEAAKIKTKYDDRTVYDILQEAFDAGAKLKVCESHMDFWDEDLIPEVTDKVGGAYVITTIMDDDTVALTF